MGDGLTCIDILMSCSADVTTVQLMVVVANVQMLIMMVITMVR